MIIAIQGMSQTYLKDTTLRDSSFHIITTDEGDTIHLKDWFGNTTLVKQASNIFISLTPSTCKTKRYSIISTVTTSEIMVKSATQLIPTTPDIVPSAKLSFLKIHGNVLYDVSYRSNIDTPFSQHDIYQHTVQTYLDIRVKDQYPIRLYLTNRFSNSSFFQNFSNINLQFNPQQFQQQIINQVKQIALKQALANHQLHELDSLLLAKKKAYAGLEQWLRSPATLQKLVEDKEKSLIQQNIKQKLVNEPTLINPFESGLNRFETSKTLLPNNPLKRVLQNEVDSSVRVIDSIVKTTSDRQSKIDSYASKLNSFKALYENNQRKLDTLKSELDKAAKNLQQSQQYATNADKSSLDAINSINNIKDLENQLHALHIPDTVLPKGYKTLLAIKSFGVGRNMLDYSELTAKNISVTGLQIEYNPSYYLAVATGYVDYRFRDIIIQQNSPKQYLNIIRFGKGAKEGNHIIASYYFGSRQLYNANSTLPNVVNPNYNLVGYSVEAQYKLNKTTFLVAEIAKSSQPYYTRTNIKPNLLAEAVSFNERFNEAYAIKLHTFLPQTATAISGTFKRTGNNFQSFSVFTTGAEQTNWMVKIDQPFLKRRLMVSASLRTNDFVNPYVGNNYKSSTVFKSLQASLRLKKWPIITAGYYPSSQLIKLADGQYTENLFYTLIGTVNHTYKYHSTIMNSALVYSRFYNKPTDTGFVYFNTTNILLSQQVFLNKLTVQFNASSSRNTDYRLYILEANGQYKIKTWLSVGAGVKYNTQPNYNVTMFGYASNATISIKQLGEIQFLVDKGFIPGANKQLVPNNIGRLSYFKIF